MKNVLLLKKFRKNRWYCSTDIERWGLSLQLKDSTVGRMLRQMHTDGLLERELRRATWIDDSGHKRNVKIVWYKKLV